MTDLPEPPAPPTGQPSPPVPQPTFLPPPPPPPPPPVAGTPYVTPPPGGRPGRRRMVAVAVAAVIAVVAGVFAVTSLSASERGASSPDEAVHNLFAALGDEDAIGMLDTLDPGERDILVPTLRGAKDELVRLGIVKDIDLGKVPGVDLTVEGLETSSEVVFDGVAKVKVTGGSLSYSTRPDAVPLGDVLRDLIESTGGDPTIPESHDTTDLGDRGGDSYVVAIKGDGGWYVSILATVAEQARAAADLDPPDPAAAVVAKGAGSPEDAVRAFLGAAADLDLERLISTLPPDEARVLQLYAPLFLADAQDSIDSFKHDGDFALSFSDLALSSTDGELGKIVKVDGGTAELTVDGESMSVTASDGCFTLDASGRTASDLSDAGIEPGTPLCADDLQSSLSDSLSDSGGDGASLFGELSARFAKVTAGIVTVERDGAWFVSPTRSVLELVLQLLKAIDKADLQPGGFLYELANGGG